MVSNEKAQLPFGQQTFLPSIDNKKYQSLVSRCQQTRPVISINTTVSTVQTESVIIFPNAMICEEPMEMGSGIPDAKVYSEMDRKIERNRARRLMHERAGRISPLRPNAEQQSP